MQASQSTSHKNIRILYLVLVLAFEMAVVVQSAAAEDTSARLQKPATALNQFAESSGHDIRPEIATADCVAVIPGFKKGAAVVGVSFVGRAIVR